MTTTAAALAADYSGDAALHSAARAMLAAGDELAAAALDIHPTAPSSASITRLRAAIEAWDAVIARAKASS